MVKKQERARTRGRTRNRILNILKVDGPTEAAVLAGELKVSAMAVRQHLYEMQEEGFVSYEERPRRVGRPAKYWKLMGKADRYFPDAHRELASNLIAGVRNVFGAEGVEKLLAVRSEEQVKSYGKRLDKKKMLQEKLRALAAIRTEEGYMAAVHGEGHGGYLLVENHCPICTAARTCSGLCASEIEVFRTVLGGGCRVERTEHILSGARRCAYRVVERD